MIRNLTVADTDDAYELYKTLTPEIAQAGHFAIVVKQPNTVVAGAEVDGKIIAMATLHLMANMTQGGRPYGLIENVVTLVSHRNQGWMRQVMNYLHSQAWRADAYKIMLMTGRDTGANKFYEALGYSAGQKYGMQIRRVPPRKVNG